MQLGDKEYVVAAFGGAWAVQLKQVVWADDQPNALAERHSTVATCFAQDRAEQIAKALNEAEGL